MTAKFIVINAQLALFVKDSLIRPDRYVENFNLKMGSIFDAPPTILPVPDLPELEAAPIVQLASNDKVYTSNMSRSRVDFYRAGLGEQSFSDLKNDFSEKAIRCFDFFSSNAVRVKRIGFVVRFFIETSDAYEAIFKALNPGLYTIHGGRGHEGFIRYVTRLELDPFRLNNYTTLEKYSARILGSARHGVLLVRDFNTIPDDDYSEQFSSQKLSSLINFAESKFKLAEFQKLLCLDK